MERKGSLAIVLNGCSSLTTYLVMGCPMLSLCDCVIFSAADSLSCLAGVGAAESVVPVVAGGGVEGRVPSPNVRSGSKPASPGLAATSSLEVVDRLTGGRGAGTAAGTRAASVASLA